MTPYLDDGDVVLYHGDVLDVLRKLPAESVDAVVTDPPYGIRFMGKAWDGAEIEAAAKRDRETRNGLGPHSESRPGRAAARTSSAFGPPAAQAGAYDLSPSANRAFQEWCEAWAAEALRVLKPGGHLLAFGGTRTYHRLACAIEDAGFEVRDCLVWLYGSGFPKSLDVSKAIDRAAGAEREVVGPSLSHGLALKPGRSTYVGEFRGERPDAPPVTAPATREAATWQGWGTALKPGHEPIVLARKPLAERTVGGQVLATGTGALNVDGCRIESNGEHMVRGVVTKRTTVSGDERTGKALGMYGAGSSFVPTNHPAGRWPANVVLDEAAAALLDAEVGERPGMGKVRVLRRGATTGAGMGYGSSSPQDSAFEGYGDTGGPSRFFYTGKASGDEREGSKHPTVKPLALMRWLVRLVTPPGGVVLDPFTGSGTTLRAAREEGFRAIGIEREAEYLADAAHRLRQLSLLGEAG